jgi:hypothetical protein
MYSRKHIFVRIAAYIAVFVIAYVLSAAIALALFGEGISARLGAAALAVACVAIGRYISVRAWGKAAEK